MLTVAILSDEDFDARDIDHTSVVFGPSQAACMRDRARWEDVDGDGRADLVLKFRCGNTKTGKQQVLCRFPRGNRHPQHPHPNFSPDGTKIAFTVADGPNSQVAWVDVSDILGAASR